MKIYNKKTFASGIFMLSLAALNLVLYISNKDFTIKGVILVVALYLLGSFAVVHSLSRKMAKEDRLEELDERNQFIELKSKRRSLELAQALSFLIIPVLLITGKIFKNEGLTAISVGLGIALSFSILAEIFTRMYYDSKN